MEDLTDKYLDDIEKYVTEYLKAKSVARMKADIKKSIIEWSGGENGHECDAKAQRFIDWKEMKDKIEEQKNTILNLEKIIKDINNGNDIATKYSELNTDYILLFQKHKQRLRDLNRWKKQYKDSLKETNKQRDDRVAIKKAKETVKKYDEISERFSDMRTENRELRFQLEKANKRIQDLNKGWEEKENMYDSDGNYINIS